MNKRLSNLVVLGGVTLLTILPVLGLHKANGKDPNLWPEITCHKHYDHAKQKTFSMTNSLCKDGTKFRKDVAELAGINDTKGCILWRLQGIFVDVNDDEDVTYDFFENQGLRKSLLTIFNGLYSRKMSKPDNDERKAFVNGLLEKSVVCKPILNEWANLKKQSSNKWTNFYDCVNNAWKCSV